MVVYLILIFFSNAYLVNFGEEKYLALSNTKYFGTPNLVIM
jgi:hypothetical protein